MIYGEMERAQSVASRCAQQGIKADGNEIVRELVDELSRSGARMPESTRDVLRHAAAQVLLLLREVSK
ncbi:hypothetical protein [Burkholderia seminalis]|uniref:hypothetical protein n=1 Tax=Burkholderia seminalis TaxID=488731 RepID=UPI001453EE0E|nr:hypothetical protein [Burkholderia seminalis]MCA8435353.1 hypothetical protein [Burkholderia seminalis]VWC35870.1 hypothetical protein BSE24067_06680 [Burkholderia seminalis]